MDATDPKNDEIGAMEFGRADAPRVNDERRVYVFSKCFAFSGNTSDEGMEGRRVSIGC